MWSRIAPLCCLAASCGGFSVAAYAQFVVVPPAEPRCLFGAGERRVPIIVHNCDSNTVAKELRIYLFQESSATVVPLANAAWKRLEILGGQTIMESAQVSFPSVSAMTRFRLQWRDDSKRVIGNTEIIAYPQDLLNELKPMLKERPIAIYDPANELSPLLKDLHIETRQAEDLEQEEGCRLAILGPFHPEAKPSESLCNTARRIAEKGIAVIWVRSASRPIERLTPSFYVVHQDKSTIVVADPDLVADFAVNPRAQLNLVHLAELALSCEPSHLESLFMEK